MIGGKKLLTGEMDSFMRSGEMGCKFYEVWWVV